jgi:hypothetical protein
VSWTMSLGGDGGGEGREVPVDFDALPEMMMDGFEIDFGQGGGIDQSAFVGGGGRMTMLEEKRMVSEEKWTGR